MLANIFALFSLASDLLLVYSYVAKSLKTLLALLDKTMFEPVFILLPHSGFVSIAQLPHLDPSVLFLDFGVGLEGFYMAL
jgi:hypothetical protein